MRVKYAYSKNAYFSKKNVKHAYFQQAYFLENGTAHIDHTHTFSKIQKTRLYFRKLHAYKKPMGQGLGNHAKITPEGTIHLFVPFVS